MSDIHDDPPPSGDLPRESSKNTLYCSFCGKSQNEVRKLIAGPTVFICDECVELCMDIIREETKQARKPEIKDLDPGDKYPIHFGVEMPECSVIGRQAAKVVDIVAELDIKQIADPKQLEAVIAWLIIGLAREEIIAQVEADSAETEAKLEQVRDAIDSAGSGDEEEIRLFAKEAEISIDSGRLSEDEAKLTVARRERHEEHLTLFEKERCLRAHLNYLESYRANILKDHPTPEEDGSETAAQ